MTQARIYECLDVFNAIAHGIETSQNRTFAGSELKATYGEGGYTEIGGEISSTLIGFSG